MAEPTDVLSPDAFRILNAIAKAGKLGTLAACLDAIAEQCLIQLRQQLYAIDLLHGVVTFSGGIVQACEEESLDHALHRADLLLYAAKEQGRDRVLMETLSLHTAPRQEESEASMV